MGHTVEESEPSADTIDQRDDLEPIRRLVQLQSEIVDLARRNREAKRTYLSLRKDWEAEFVRRNGARRGHMFTGLLSLVQKPKGITARACMNAVTRVPGLLIAKTKMLIDKR